jgi:hypothetical protein
MTFVIYLPYKKEQNTIKVRILCVFVQKGMDRESA